MALPQAVLDLLSENAENNGAAPPLDGDDLFKTGVLDSFGLVDFVAALEEHCGIKIPDADVSPANFQTLAAIETYVASHRS
ncbi:MAG TPA: phosphopantetheine-binding protein [Pyrinomonadaceae bacterium]|jgi:acyl carrier protein|nr:phosphopantetheine-binding protein [Pyrinomonadaceae bacterium]